MLELLLIIIMKIKNKNNLLPVKNLPPDGHWLRPNESRTLACSFVKSKNPWWRERNGGKRAPSLARCTGGVKVKSTYSFRRLKLFNQQKKLTFMIANQIFKMSSKQVFIDSLPFVRYKMIFKILLSNKNFNQTLLDASLFLVLSMKLNSFPLLVLQEFSNSPKN